MSNDNFPYSGTTAEDQQRQQQEQYAQPQLEPLDHLNMPGDDETSGVSAMTLTTLLNSGVEEAIKTLSPAQRKQFGKSINELKKLETPTTRGTSKKSASRSPGDSLHLNHTDDDVGLTAADYAASNLDSLGGDDSLSRLSFAGGSMIDPETGLEVDLNSFMNSGMLGMHHDLLTAQSSEDLYSLPTSTPRGRGSSGRRGGSSTPRHYNQPSSAPICEIRDGVEYITFNSQSKGHPEITVRADIETVNLDDIPEDFKAENYVYQRAYCNPENYTGNRWEYETNCNEIAWKLCWLNPGVLAGKRGLIQGAVDSYRNRFTETRSRRVIRQEKITTGTLRRRNVDTSRHSNASSSDDGTYSASRTPGSATSRRSSSGSIERNTGKMLTFSWNSKGVPAKCRIRIDIESVDPSLISDSFRLQNCLYPHVLEDTEGLLSGRYAYENAINELGWKLAFLNPSKLADGKKHLLQKAVDAYRNKFESSPMHQDVASLLAASGDYAAAENFSTGTHASDASALNAYYSAATGGNSSYDHHHHHHHTGQSPEEMIAAAAMYYQNNSYANFYQESGNDTSDFHSMVAQSFEDQQRQQQHGNTH